MQVLEQTLAEIKPLDAAAMTKAAEHIRNLTMPTWALGRLCDLAVQLSGITGKVKPVLNRRLIMVMAGDHGVVAEGVSLQDSVITQQMVVNMTRGGAGVNVLGRMNQARVAVADFGMLGRDEELVRAGQLIDANVGKGTENIANGPAMNREAAVKSIENGIKLAKQYAPGFDMFGTGEMGIGNTTPSTAIAAVITGESVASLTGMGGGLSQERIKHKIAVIEKAIEFNQPNPKDALDILAKIGGFEIGGIAGLILGGAACRRVVLVDGFISTAGALLAKLICPAVGPYLLVSHASAEPGHRGMCTWLGVEPLLRLNMRLGEGTGAALAMNVVEGACRMMAEMATFTTAGVDENPD